MIVRVVAALGMAMLAWGEPLTVPFVAQQKNGCGAASVAMVMQYWSGQRGSGASYPDAGAVYQTLYNPTLRGIPLVEMKQYLEAQGFRTYTLHGKWSDLETHLHKGRPLIVALKKKQSGPMHFAVVTGTASGEALLNDPTREKTTRIKRKEFEKLWSRADAWTLLAVPKE